MSEAPPCMACGHAADEHDPVPILSIRRSGRFAGYHFRGRCTLEEDDGRTTYSCLCREYRPERYPALVSLLGFDVVRAGGLA